MNANHILHNLMIGLHMNFSQLQSLVALADQGSFTEAADTVNLTQSAVSHALAALESELGVMLLERNRKGVGSLTSAGQKIIPHVRALLAQAEAIHQEAKAAQGLAIGKLRVGHVLSFCPDLLASVLTRFQQQYPDVEVVLFEGTMQEVSEWINSSLVDVGFVLHPARGLASTLVGTDELCLLVAPGHRLAGQRAVTADDLRGEGLIMAKAECAFQMMEMAGLEPSRVRMQIRYQASDSTTILAMVREGLGSAVLPRKMLPNKLDGVVAVPLDHTRQLQIGLAVRSHETASPAARLFVQTAQASSRQALCPSSSGL
jgi:DNA-binding transcriptional LysR family regulator